VRASHILIKHEGSRRRASWRDPEGVAISATTRDDAADLARALRDQIVSGGSKFEDIAAENSDCNSAKRGGDLGQCHPPVPLNSSCPPNSLARTYGLSV
jgi:NIMA-interacting peptidyl-prolyl cis-trans isomerase 1